MEPTTGLMVLGLVVFASASFFFALAESAFFALGQWRARQMAAQPGGAIVVRLLEQPSELLATIVLGNTMANSALVALALSSALHGSISPAWTLTGVAILILVGCEILPKSLAVRDPELWALRVGRPMLWVQRSTGWLERLVRRFNELLLRVLTRGASKPQPVLTDEEYKELVDLAVQQGALGQSEKEIILQIISLDRKTVRDVMKPRSQMAAISDDLSIEEMIAASRTLKHRRLPIYDETPDTIVGILNSQALLLDPHANLEDAMEFPSFVPETMNLLQLLKSLERQQRSMAIVMDEFGGTAGLVTLEDILEEVLGRMPEEIETGGFVMEKLAEGRWRVNGTARLSDFRREYPSIGDVPAVDTMGGLLVFLLDVVPAVGESTIFRGVRLTAKAVDDRRVKELLAEVVRRRGREE
ncbi:MAG: magnesium and cobalt exporter, family [Verrucomicrobiota bacterium]|jgi:putative hemolysin